MYDHLAWFPLPLSPGYQANDHHVIIIQGSYDQSRKMSHFCLKLKREMKSLTKLIMKHLARLEIFYVSAKLSLDVIFPFNSLLDK